MHFKIREPLEQLYGAAIAKLYSNPPSYKEGVLLAAPVWVEKYPVRPIASPRCSTRASDCRRETTASSTSCSSPSPSAMRSNVSSS